MYANLTDNCALKYGREMESVARKCYEEMTGNTVIKSGLLVCHEQPWLAASPDGLVFRKDNRCMTLEIKCPFRCRDSVINVDNTLTFS